MGQDQAQVTVLVDDTLKLLGECDAGGRDPLLEDAWHLLADMTGMGGARLTEQRLGALIPAADEVELYLGQMERVSKCAKGAPFQVPGIAIRRLKAVGRFVEDTRDRDEVCAFLLAVPQLAEGYSEYLARAAGRHARPVIELLDLVVRSGSVYRDSLVRAVPALMV